MSFVYARKYLNKIRVFADNKMTIAPKDELFFIKSIGMENYRKIKSLGVIKNVIINQNICICSAGMLEDYNDLLKYVDNNTNLTYEDICNEALKINIKANNRTDFIICTVKDTNKITQIKDYNMEETESSWIGSKECFEKFQSIRLSEKMKNQTIYNCASKTELPYDAELIDITSFSKTLKSNIDDSVGEISIECVSRDNKFCYMDKLFTSISKPRTLEKGKNLKIYDDVFNGGYTYYVYKSFDNYKLYINQLNCGVVYCPCVSYEKYNHLRIPKFEYCDVKDFEKNYNCEEVTIIMNV